MTVQEAIQFLEALRVSLNHEATPAPILALSVAIAVLKALSPEQVKVVNRLYAVDFDPVVKF